jgi:hypothetical protein
MPAERVLPDVMELIDARPSLLWIHVIDSRALLGRRGFPDLLICGPHGMLAREVKPDQWAQLSRQQTCWRWMLTANRVNYAIWTREDVGSGRVGRELDAIA